MRWGGLACAVTCAWSLVGCARLNPAYVDADEASTGTPSATSGAETTTGAGPGTAGAGEGEAEAGSVSDTGLGVDVGEPGDCGNGTLEAGEDCDDGNVLGGDACTAECEHPFVVEWTEDFDIVPGVSQRFNALSLTDQGFVAAGRGAVDGKQPERALLVHIDATGAELWRTYAGPTEGAEALGVLVEDEWAYVAGRGVDAGTDVAFAAGVYQPSGEAVTPPWSTLISGTRAQSLILRDDVLVIGTGRYDRQGLGFAGLDPIDGASVFGGWVSKAGNPSQVRAIVEAGSELLISGMLMGDAFVARVPDYTDPMVPTALFSVSGDSMGDDDFQALVVRDDGLIIAGGRVRGTDAEGENALVVAYDEEFGMEWRWDAEGGSTLDDEVEALALTDEGDVIVGGMIGDPPQPWVWKLSGDDGTPIWSDSFEHEMFESGFVRGVGVDDDAIFIVGEREVEYAQTDGDNDTIAWAARLTDLTP